MSTTSDYGYNYVFELASRLTPEEQRRLVRELPVEETVDLHRPNCSREEYARILLDGPVLSKEKIHEMENKMQTVLPENV